MKSVSQDITHYQAILSYAEKHGGANGCHHAPYVSTDLSIAYVSGVTLGGGFLQRKHYSRSITGLYCYMKHPG